MARCVDLGLSAFGSNMKRATYLALGIDEVSSSEITSDPETLLQALKVVFGQGYVFAEISIILEVKKEFDLKSPTSSYTIPIAFKIACAEMVDRSDDC